MKKYTPYFLAILLVAAVIALFVTGNNNNSQKKLDGRITLQKKDKIPYGTYVAYNSLSHLFPSAAVYTNKHEPGYWDSLSSYDTHQAYIVIADRFTADEDELKKMIGFVKAGNDVFISARYFSSAADEMFGFSSSSYDLSFFPEEGQDSMKISLHQPPFEKDITYTYPGRTFYSYFDQLDTATTAVLGYDEKHRSNFIHLRVGSGNFYLHMEPLAFSNYFLLHKNNIDYYEKALSVLAPGVNKIVWDEYYLNKSQYDKPPQKRKSWLSVLFQYPAFKAALLTAILALVVYILLEMRRKQRYIPVVTKPKNDSLNFVKTIGRLYYDKGDHKNLCRKMAAYFLEHVRNKYKLSTGSMNEEFINTLKYKSGADETQIREIVSFIKYLEDVPAVSSKQLTDFHKQLEAFYKKA